MNPSNSFFQDDFVDKVFRWLLGQKHYRHIGAYIIVPITLFWIPVFLLTFLGGLEDTTTFIRNYAAYTQFMICFPLFLIARKVMDYEWTSIERIIQDSKIIKESFVERYELSQSFLKHTLNGPIATWLTILIPYILTMAVYIAHLLEPGYNKYYDNIPGHPLGPIRISGLYLWLISIPAFLILIAYWVVRYLAWVKFLWNLALAKPKLDGCHPDRMGGLGFLTRTISAFSIIIFAIGTVTVTTVFFIIDNEGRAISDPLILILIIPYILFAPTLFIMPLLFFTKPMYMAKAEAMQEFNKGTYKKVKEYAPSDIDCMYRTAKRMRIIPFDFSSIAQLYLSVVTPMLPFIIRIIDFSELSRDFVRKFRF